MAWRRITSVGPNVPSAYPEPTPESTSQWMSSTNGFDSSTSLNPTRTVTSRTTGVAAR